MSRAILETLTGEERMVLRLLEPVRALKRRAVAGLPFHHATAPLNSRLGRMHFGEALILGMVAKGVLDVTQSVKAWPGRIDYCPFAVCLSKVGIECRQRELSVRRGGRRGLADEVPANDDHRSSDRSAA